MKKIRLGVLGSTRGTDMQAILDAINSGELSAEIVLVVSDNEKAGILDKARKNNVETLVVDYKKFSNREDVEKVIVQKLVEKNVDLLLLIGYMKILTPYFVSRFRGKIWNIHPSLLPKYAGGMNMSVHEQVIKNKDEFTGCTLHEVSEKVDAGKIIMQKKIRVLSNDTPETLKARVQKLEGKCLVEAIKKLIESK